jgi:hypothetical protein
MQIYTNQSSVQPAKARCTRSSKHTLPLLNLTWRNHRLDTHVECRSHSYRNVVSTTRHTDVHDSVSYYCHHNNIYATQQAWSAVSDLHVAESRIAHARGVLAQLRRTSWSGAINISAERNHAASCASVKSRRIRSNVVTPSATPSAAAYKQSTASERPLPNLPSPPRPVAALALVPSSPHSGSGGELSNPTAVTLSAAWRTRCASHMVIRDARLKRGS